MESDPAGDALVVVSFVSRWLPLTENWIYNQVRFLPASIVTHVVCRDTENLARFPIANLHVQRDVPKWRRSLQKRLARLGGVKDDWFLERQILRSGAHLLHSHFGHMGWANRKTASRTRAGHVVTFYGFDINYLPQLDPVWRDRYQELFSDVDRILCEGSHMAGCIAELGAPPAKIRVHHLGIPVDQLSFRPRKWDGREPLRILMAASFQEKKGIPLGLEAIAMLRNEIDTEVTIVGDANEEERSRREKQRILDTIRARGLEKIVRMTGYRPYDELLEEAYRHHVFLAPSLTASDGDTEGGAPVVLIDMAATGIPVVSTMHCDIPNVVLHGKTGLLSEERDAEGLRANLAWLAEHPGRWPAMLLDARKRVEEEFDSRVQGERLAKIYREVAGP